MSDVIQSDREAARVRAITAIRALVVDLETWSPEMIEDLRNTPQAALMREWLSRPSRLASSADLRSKLDVAREALRNIRALAAKRQNEGGPDGNLQDIESFATAALATIGGPDACPDCQRSLLPDAMVGSGFIAKCGRRLARIDQCVTGGCEVAIATQGGE